MIAINFKPDLIFLDLKGRSIVYLFLQFQRDTKHAVEGLQKLFEVYREDFKYIISPCLSEIRLLVGEFTGHHNQIINLLQKSKLVFPALGKYDQIRLKSRIN